MIYSTQLVVVLSWLSLSQAVDYESGSEMLNPVAAITEAVRVWEEFFMEGKEYSAKNAVQTMKDARDVKAKYYNSWIKFVGYEEKVISAVNDNVFSQPAVNLLKKPAIDKELFDLIMDFIKSQKKANRMFVAEHDENSKKIEEQIKTLPVKDFHERYQYLKKEVLTPKLSLAVDALFLQNIRLALPSEDPKTENSYRFSLTVNESNVPSDFKFKMHELLLDLQDHLEGGDDGAVCRTVEKNGELLSQYLALINRELVLTQETWDEWFEKTPYQEFREMSQKAEKMRESIQDRRNEFINQFDIALNMQSNKDWSEKLRKLLLDLSVKVEGVNGPLTEEKKEEVLEQMDDVTSQMMDIWGKIKARWANGTEALNEELRAKKTEL